MDDAEARKIMKEVLEALPESVTGSKDDKEYPLKNVEWFTNSFKKNADGTIDIKYIRSVATWVLSCLRHAGLLTATPLLVTASEQEHENINGETPEWVSVDVFLDKTAKGAGEGTA